MSITPDVPPRRLIDRSTSVENGVAFVAPKRANRRSREASPKWVRIIAITTPIPTAAPITTATAIDNATPVSVRGSK